jgi:hypothetical protein
MTALVFALQPDEVYIAMDTLLIGADDRMPMSFKRKFLSVPESDLVVAGTGHADFINGWFQHLHANLQGATIDDLNKEAPNIFRASVSAEGGLSGLTATIYHFGYSAQEHRYAGYAYRSEHSFRSERLQYALGLKPVVPVAPNDDIRFPDFLIDIVLKQQCEDRLRPITERVGIGGEIEFVVMSDRAIHVETVHRFSSYEAESLHIEQRSEA